MSSRDALRAELMSMTVRELYAMGVTSIKYSRKADLVNQMVEVMIGRNLDSEAIERVVMGR